MYNLTNNLDKKKILTLVSLLIILVAIPLGVYLAQKTQIFKPKATALSCASDKSGQSVSQACVDGIKFLVYEYADQEQCRLFYEATSNSCSETPNPSSSTDPGGAEIDLNGDGKMDLLDLSVMLSNMGKSGQNIGKYDLNKDGIVNSIDYAILISELTKKQVIKSSN